jgi:16S rRNA (guanine527-N7)-methyltransferase
MTQRLEIVLKYFPLLTEDQILKFTLLSPQYRYWTSLVKVFPEKDFETFHEHQVLHSLAIAKVVSFPPGSTILDVGTGGGFPGIPLAILFPECNFTLIDFMHKRIKVVQSVIDSIGLKNTCAIHGKIEDYFEQFDFVVSRAVKEFPIFVGLVQKNFDLKLLSKNLNGILYLKGGNFEDELANFDGRIRVYEISDFFMESYFQAKKIIYLTMA